MKTFFCFAYVALSMIFLAPFGMVAMLFSVIGFRNSMTAVLRLIAQGWARSAIRTIGCKVTVSGKENVPRKGGLCFVSNHGSIFDILILLAYSGRTIGFIAKKELAVIPILNLWIFLLGGLFIDRKNPRKALKTINKGIEKIKAGGSMLIFPEGSRSRGKGLLPFHPGSLKLATQAGALIVPVALAGTYEIFEKYGRATASPVKIIFCKPVETANLPATDKKQILADQMHGIIKEALENNEQ